MRRLGCAALIAALAACSAGSAAPTFPAFDESLHPVLDDGFMVLADSFWAKGQETVDPATAAPAGSTQTLSLGDGSADEVSLTPLEFSSSVGLCRYVFVGHEGSFVGGPGSCSEEPGQSIEDSWGASSVVVGERAIAIAFGRGEKDVSEVRVTFAGNEIVNASLEAGNWLAAAPLPLEQVQAPVTSIDAVNAAGELVAQIKVEPPTEGVTSH